MTERRRGAAIVLGLIVAVCLASVGPAEAVTHRAVVSDTLLATEDDGALFLEVLAGDGDTSASLADHWAGNRSAAPVIRGANGGAEPASGKFYRIPFGVLRDEHRRVALAALYPDELPKPPLEYHKDAKGDYAVYKLRAGEALYSSVVVRFTGRVDVDEVNSLAKVIAARSGIRDMRRIPVGGSIKIPANLLLPEFQAPGTPAREQEEAAIAAAASHELSRPAALLDGVYVVLDAGHGGNDPGAIRHGVYEDEHAYDVMCRVKKLLETKTRAHVYTTILDRSSGYKPLDGKIHQDTDEWLVMGKKRVYNLRSKGATRRGVNERPRIANHIEADLRARGVPDERMVFLSFHADALHGSIRGTMIYVPGSERARYLPSGVTPAARENAMGLSRRLARDILSSLRKHKILVHPNPAIRDRVIRSGRAFIPAVVRETRIPHALLIEVANLNNTRDRSLLIRGSFRQSFAEAIVDALVDYYGPQDKDKGPEIAALH